jgi:hypothetical protein
VREEYRYIASDLQLGGTAMNDRVKSDGNEHKSPESPPTDEDRYGRDEVTGLEYVKRRPGDRMITSEEVRKELEDFP